MRKDRENVGEFYVCVYLHSPLIKRIEIVIYINLCKEICYGFCHAGNCAVIFLEQYPQGG